MKKLIKITTALMIALLFNASTSFAFPSISATANSKNEMIQAITQIVKFPEKGFDRKESGYVLTSFKVNENGFIEVTEIKGITFFKCHVRNQIEKISVENSDLYGKHFKIKIYFDYQEK